MSHQTIKRSLFFALLTLSSILSATVTAQQYRYFGDLDGTWNNPMDLAEGVVPGEGDQALLIRPYFGTLPVIQPILINYRSATAPRLSGLIIESSNWLFQDEEAGYDALQCDFETIGGFSLPLDGEVDQVDNPGLRSRHVQRGGSNTVTTFLTMGGIEGSGGLYELSGGDLNTLITNIGDGGIGQFEQTGGSHITNFVLLGASATGVGTLNHSGGDLQIAEDMQVGAAGEGTFTQTGTANTTISRDLLLGTGASAIGNLTFDGTGDFNVLGRIQVNRGLFQHSGGTVNTTGNVDVETEGAYSLDAGAVQTATGNLIVNGQFDLQGGELSVAETQVTAGTFEHVAGEHVVSRKLRIGNETVATGTYRMQNGMLTVDEEMFIGSRGGVGAFELEDGLVLVNDAVLIGYEAQFTVPPILEGDPGMGSLTISGGEFRAERMHLSDSGDETAINSAQVFQDGGLVVSRGEISLGLADYFLNDGELRSAALPTTDPQHEYYQNSALIVGGLVRGNLVEPSGVVGGADFIQNGGQNNVGGDLAIGQHRSSIGVFQLNDGVLDVQDNLVIGTEAGFSVGLYEQHGGDSDVMGNLENWDSFFLGGGSMVIRGDINNHRGSLFRLTRDVDLTSNGYTLHNEGLMTIDDAGTKVVRGPVENTGDVELANTSITFADTFTNNGKYESSSSESVFDDFVVEADGYLVATGNDRFVVNGNFSNTSLQNELWDTGSAELSFQGTVAHIFGLAGVDSGVGLAGYDDNFAWGELTLGTGDVLTLVDSDFDGDAALYIGLLSINELSQLDSIVSEFNIYYDPTLIGNDFLGGQTFSLKGSGRLIASVPEPGALGLLMIGCCGLPLCRRRCLQATSADSGMVNRNPS